MDKIYIVMDYVEHDLKSLMETMKQPFTIGEAVASLKDFASFEYLTTVDCVGKRERTEIK